MNELNCIVVDDSLIFRKVVRDCLAQLPGTKVIDVANDGIRAVEKIVKQRPDLVTLDVEMPGLNGLEVLRAIREQKVDTDVIMVSSQTDRAASVTTQALSLGAFDYILKPNQDCPDRNIQELVSALAPKVDAIRRRRQRLAGISTPATTSASTNGFPRPIAASNALAAATERLRATAHDSRNIRPAQRTPRSGQLGIPDIIVIGISTGGPAALREMLPKLAADFPVPILVVQHMPPLFTASLARDLDQVCKLTVREATHGEPIRSGTVYIAPGGAQMRIGGAPGSRIVEITDDPPIRACKPSVDYLFESAAKSYGASTLAVVMTGMGNDGTAGSRAINRVGGRTIAQDEASCTVYGMPRQIIDAGLADRIESLSNLAALLTRAVTSGATACL